MSIPRLNQLASHLQPPPPDSTPNPPKAYAVSQEPLGTARHVRLVSIGAGASGLNMIRTVRNRLLNVEHIVYEKNPDVGGTWFENRYPGCKCDIPSHNYQFSWRQNPQWSAFFSPAEEIHGYLKKMCAEEDMMGLIKLQHMVTGAVWNEVSGVWNITVKDLATGKEFDDYCHFLLDSSGILNNWKWPDIPGLQSFKGNLVHSANWPKDFEYANKVVAVIGNGSSGVQIVPAIRPDVKRLVHFVREATWIVPPRLQTLQAGQAGSVMAEIEFEDDDIFTEEQKQKFKSDKDFYRKFIKAIEVEVNSGFFITLKDSDHAAFVTQVVREYMQDALNGDERLCKALIPEFSIGCRRLTPGIGYLESLTAENVSVVTDGISQVTETGLVTSTGEIIAVDAIICATGFNVSFRPRFPIVAGDKNLQDIWTQKLPRAYMSLAVPEFPNYFTFMGPNAPIGHGSVLTITEKISNYLVDIIKKCQTKGIEAIAPSRRATDQLAQHTQAFMPVTAWASPCKSWFKSGTRDGPVTALHPGSRIHFFHMLERFRGEDWEYTYQGRSGNRFEYLGNGLSTKELGDEDSTWYLDDPDA